MGMSRDFIEESEDILCALRAGGLCHARPVITELDEDGKQCFLERPIRTEKTMFSSTAMECSA